MAVQLYTSLFDKAGGNAFMWVRDISRNLATPVYLLRRLAASSDSELRIAVADHLNTPEELLLFLANDENPDVRYALAENHNISQKVLNKLLDDANPYVAHRAQTTLDRLSDEACRQPIWCTTQCA